MTKGERAVSLREAGWSNAGIASVLGMKPGSVRRLISEARQANAEGRITAVRHLPPSGDGSVGSSPTPPTHVVIPDTQCKPGVPLEHLRWAGRYIAERQPSTVIHLGDHWDMESLSEYDRGKKSFEGRRYHADIAAGNEGMALLMEGISRCKVKPRLIFLRGNHEQRIERVIEAEPRLEGTVGYQDMDAALEGWEIFDFLHPVEVDGVTYAHYFYQPNSGRPYAGAVDTMLRNIGHSFTMGHQQGLRWGRRELPNGQVQIGLVAGCLTPNHRVLTADLRYVPIGDLAVGDRLVSFDEECGDSGGRGRRFRTGTLLQAARDFAPVYEVRLASGKIFQVTGDHGWLVRRRGAVDYEWRTTAAMRIGDQVPKVLPEWEPADTYQAGWLAGIYDGEGHLYARRTTSGYACQLGVSQKTGKVLTAIQEAIRDVLGTTPVTEFIHNDVMAIRLQGGTAAIARALGILRPQRLLAKFEPPMLGGLTIRIGKTGVGLDRVVSIEPLGEQEIVRTLVDCGTMIVEGYPHHNSFYQHEELYKGPQGNGHWRGLVVKHEVSPETGYDPMFVSLNYLKRRFA